MSKVAEYVAKIKGWVQSYNQKNSIHENSVRFYHPVDRAFDIGTRWESSEGTEVEIVQVKHYKDTDPSKISNYHVVYKTIDNKDKNYEDVVFDRDAWHFQVRYSLKDFRKTK